MRNIVFIATSFDGYIADKNGGIEWLTEIPSPTGGDGGFSKMMESVDAMLMGRKTFEKVLSFGIEWPYSKMVFVWTNTLDQIPPALEGKVEIVRGDIENVLRLVHGKGFANLYIDGGRTIQSFLNKGLIHKMIVTLAPILLGKGIRLFANTPRTKLHHRDTLVFDNGMVQIIYEVQAEEQKK